MLLGILLLTLGFIVMVIATVGFVYSLASDQNRPDSTPRFLWRIGFVFALASLVIGALGIVANLETINRFFQKLFP